MGKLINDTTDDKWVGNITQETKSKTYSFHTNDMYVDKDIDFIVTAKVSDISNDNPSGTNITLSETDTSGVAIVNATTMETAGWVDENPESKTLYATKVTIAANKKFEINDGIYTWTYEVDSDGNVTIS